MTTSMTTYVAVRWDGETEFFSALTYSDAYQQATDWAEGNLLSFEQA